MEHKYKFNGIVCPYLMQAVFIIFLLVFWGIVVNSGAPLAGVIIATLISLFIIAVVYAGYPARFKTTPEGLEVVFSLGQRSFFEWKDVKSMEVTGPSAVIKVVPGKGAGKIFNKYYIFLWLLKDQDAFRQTISEYIGHEKK
ncbi:MAG: hypothetical protein K9L95_02165 [Candidatus Omnitrophica bacterium]|nr:hypothetical protein [Candidatus Omnitrophota bacterium]MCF7893416.1 hypothetical protein [Candidatus Omnitrophota bacterium]